MATNVHRDERLGLRVRCIAWISLTFLIAPFLFMFLPLTGFGVTHRNAAADALATFGLGCSFAAVADAVVAVAILVAIPSSRRNGWLWFTIGVPVFGLCLWSAVGVP